MKALPDQPLSPLDGRYQPVVAQLGEYLSEGALNRERTRIELEWLLFVTNRGMFGTTPISQSQQGELRRFAAEFGQVEINRLTELEAATRHDVKAVEYLVRSHLSASDLDSVVELVHFACTSEDINNVAYAATVRSAMKEVWNPAFQAVRDELHTRALRYRSTAMLAHTHGQPATPTTMGKEIAVFVHRLDRIAAAIESVEYLAKFSGATGTFSAHVAADPNADWPAIASEFVGSLGLSWNPLTTQIEPHDWQVELYQHISHANRILHNLCTDMWTYISLGYFRQIPRAGDTGSSTMPHKVNPIRFENAEANLELSNALLDALAHTLVTSRLQRDLTDSTTQRNIGVAIGHSLLALDNIRRGLEEIELDDARLLTDLDANWEVLGEAIQTVVRAEIAAGRSSIAEPYGLLKDFLRGQRVDHREMQEFIATLDIGTEAKTRLLALTPERYVGLADALVDHLAPRESVAPRDVKRSVPAER